MLAGCGGAREDTAASEGPVPGGTAVVALAADPDALNPLIHESKIAAMIYDVFHDGLTEMDENFEYVPRIAESWTVAADGLSITYRLRPWNWSDGAPLTARDVVFTFGLYKDPVVASPRRGFYEDVLAAVALDEATVRYDLARPLPNVLERTWHHILPAHLLEGEDPAAIRSWSINHQPLSSGEFVLEEWSHNRSLSVIRNERYPGTGALLDRVVFRVLPEEGTRLVALETGEVDLVEGIPPDAARRLGADGEVVISTTGSRRYYYLQWNCLRPAFRDVHTRRALSLAVDRRRMIETLLPGFASPAIGPLTPVVWNYHPDLLPDPFDPDRARKILTEAGWADTDGDGILDRDGVPCTMEILTKQGDPVRENGAVMLRSFLADVGVDTRIRAMELAAVLDLVRAGRFDAYYGRLNANLYGDPRGSIHSGAIEEFNTGRYANATVDSLVELALTIEDREEARPLWYELQEILVEDPPSAYLFYPDNLVGSRARLQDVEPHLLSPINNLAEWWIAPGDRIYTTGRN